MPAIDLARLRKQASRLADFFFVPEEFLKHLHEMLDFYVNRSLRTVEDIAPGSNLPTYRTPVVVIRQIEKELSQLASDNPSETLDLADILWDEGQLETMQLAAFLLGRIPPQEGRLLARLTAWTSQVRDSSVRSALLTHSLARLRKETPDQFLELIREWLHPARERTWANGFQALIPMVSEPNFQNLPPVLDAIEPIVAASPASIQLDLEALLLALYRTSPSETSFFLQQILRDPENEMARVTMRRILAAFPSELQGELRDLLRRRPVPPKGE
jgi:hypothetical protein